jgi:hypothetical protein
MRSPALGSEVFMPFPQAELLIILNKSFNSAEFVP